MDVFVKGLNVCNNKQLSDIQALARRKQSAIKRNLESRAISEGSFGRQICGSKQAMAVSKEIRLQDNIFIIEHQWK